MQCKVVDMKDKYELRCKAAILDHLQKAKLAEDAHASVGPVGLSNTLGYLLSLTIIRMIISNIEFLVKKKGILSRVRSLLSLHPKVLQSPAVAGRGDHPRNAWLKICLLVSLLPSGHHFLLLLLPHLKSQTMVKGPAKQDPLLSWKKGRTLCLEGLLLRLTRRCEWVKTTTILL